MAKEFTKYFKKEKFAFKMNKKCLSGEIQSDGQVKVIVEDRKSGKKEDHFADIVLVSTGRIPYTTNLGLDKLGIEKDKAGRIVINDKFQTKYDNIYAIGDCIEGPMLAHKAEEEGVAVAEFLAGRDIHLNYAAIPGVIYTYPEVAYVGFTEE